jgi:hypothetical protein
MNRIKRFEIRIAGFGGQGVVTIGRILGEALNLTVRNLVVVLVNQKLLFPTKKSITPMLGKQMFWWLFLRWPSIPIMLI